MPDDMCDHEWGDPEKVYDIDAEGVRTLVTDVLIRECVPCGRHDVQWLREESDA